MTTALNATPGSIVLGSTYRDKITGFQGVAIAHVRYMTGCDQIGLHPGLTADGKMGDSCYFDWTRLELVANVPPIVLTPPVTITVGGPHADVPGHSDMQPPRG